jgi:NAD(P)-dependent dehydrogenase (short-subunit alcohol dehydrogenase family)
VSRFEHKVALVTGAASGIGRAVCQRLASEGASVVGVDLNADGLADTATSVTEAGGTMTTHAGDISRRAGAFAAVDVAVSEHGGLDVLANVAGVLRIHHFLDATEDEVELLMGVNALGSIWMCQAAIPHLLERAGNIVNVASNAGLMGGPYNVVYSASKGAVVQLTRALAIEFEKTPLRVNAVAPGGVRTPMTKHVPFPDDVDFSLLEGIMSKRGQAEPEDVANVIAFVASDEAKRMHGAIVSVDEGLTAG